MKKKSINILMIIPSLEIGGGAERVAALLSTILNKKYFINFITFYNNKPKYEYEGNFYSLNLNPKSIKRLIIPLKLFQYIRRISPNVIISFIDYSNFLSYFVKKFFMLKIPLIVYISGNPKLAFEKKFRYYNQLIKFIYSSDSIDKIITVTKKIRLNLIKYYGINPDKILSIYNPINIRKINNLAKNNNLLYKNLFNNQEIIKFITIGRLIPSKRHKFLIKAFKHVNKETIKPTKLVIIGVGPLLRKLNLFVKKLNLENSVIFLGLVKNPFQYLSRSDIFVFSSLYESFGNCLIEALACGLPVISTKSESGPEEILCSNKYGLLVDPLNVYDLAEKMINLLKNRNLQNYYSKIAVKRAKEFDINNIKFKWIKLIEFLVKSNC